MRRRQGWWVLLLALLAAPRPTFGQQTEEPNLEFFYPLSTRRAVIEREGEFRLQHFKSRTGRETDVLAALEAPILPRWQVEIEVPVVFLEPRDGAVVGGIGDLTVENKLLVFKSLEQRAQIAVGFETRLPTGSERRGLGGAASIEPFAVAAIARGDFDVMGEVAYEFNVNAHVKGPQEQQLTVGTAAAYRWRRWFSPLLELRTTVLTRGPGESEGGNVLRRPVVSLTPGFNVKPLPRSTLALGVELPVTDARTFDYALRIRFIREF